ncbi:MAG: hypothetical protein WC703_04520, partial [Candidatus Neomarinimicrobiota bacterium]
GSGRLDNRPASGWKTGRLRLFLIGLIAAVCLTTVFFLASCDRQGITKYKDNKPPETSIFISTTKDLNYTQSIQTISWDGRDPDGFVVGFYYTWETNPDSNDWIYTTENSATFPLKIVGDTTTYCFQIRAVDDDGMLDPTPASQEFRIKNSAPKINWTTVSRIPDTTFTVATFIWNAKDLDGDSSVVQFEYALDDTSIWRTIPGYLRMTTLTADSGLTEGNHAFYIRAVDIAGAKSETIRMPEDSTKYWFVKEPRGRYLLIDDHGTESSQYAFPDKYYRTMMEQVVVPKGESFDYWDIESLFPKSTVQFKETVKLFDRIIWYTDFIKDDDPHFVAAQVAIPEFLEAGGKAIFIAQFNTGFGTQGDPLAFTPVDSLSKYYSRISQNALFLAQDDLKIAFPSAPALPELKVSNYIFGVFAIKPKEGSVILYRYNDTTLTERPPFILLGRNDNTGVYDFVFAGAPLHQLNGNNNLNQFFDIILNEVFD